MFSENKPLIEKICTAAWLTLSVTIEVEHDQALYP